MDNLIEVSIQICKYILFILDKNKLVAGFIVAAGFIILIIIGRTDKFRERRKAIKRMKEREAKNKEVER